MISIILRERASVIMNIPLIRQIVEAQKYQYAELTDRYIEGLTVFEKQFENNQALFEKYTKSFWTQPIGEIIAELYKESSK